MLTRKDLTEIVRLLSDNSAYWLSLAADPGVEPEARDNAEYWGLRSGELAANLEIMIPELVAGTAEPIPDQP